MLSLLRSSLSRSAYASALGASIPRTVPTLRAVQARTFVTTPIVRAPAAKNPAQSTAKKPAAKKPAAKKTATKTAGKTTAKEKPKVKKSPPPSLPMGNEPPKRPMIPFALYTKAHSEVYPYRVEEGQSKTEAWKKWRAEMIERWKGLTDAQKKVYYEQAAAARVVYGQLMQQWVDATPPDEIARRKRLLRKKGKTVPTEMRKPRSDGLKRPASPWIIFLGEFRARQKREMGMEKFTQQQSRDVTKQGAGVWNGMSDSEKEPYFKKYQEQKADYFEGLEKVKKAAL